MEDPRMIEGALSKWTNVMKGWQYRWFVLDANAGLFSYYTSKEKMSKGVRRGCVRLRGAMEKTFHFQANDAEERERWIRALEELAETDCYLQLMLDRMDKLKSLKGGEDEEVDNLLKKADNMTESIKHAIVLLQITKNAILPQSAGKECPKIIQKDSVVSDEVDNQGNQERAYRVGKEGLLIANSDFYDAEDNHQVEEPKSQGVFKENPTLKVNEDNTENDLENDDYDYDSLYSIVDESDSGEMDMKSHGSVISHLLERRSLLEMYSDFFAHPDLFIDIAEKSTPEDRMVAVLKWYLSSFHAGRRSSIAKKPYNPIIGETFYCHWDLPHSGTGNKLSENDPLPWCKDNNLVFVAEQVSHHPPISAFYAEHIKKRISVNAHIYTKSSFLGMSIAVHNVGQGSVKLLDYGEEYVATFPTGYGRSILTVPWIELGGKVSITCVQTNYTANIDFKCKPFFSSDVNKVFAEVISPTAKKPILKVDGEWNGRMNCKWVSGKSEVFIDVNEMPIVPKVCKSIFQQKRNESRRMWKDVTRHLKEGDIDKATAAKFSLEQKQRENAAARKANSVEWETKLFKKVGENWQFNNSLSKRV
ncbi:OSBPL9_10_11 [Lepeophtheirus salmonis]|uniref:Oxysterol-binding protein n=1 Tax=Lepeophtheirus salmonis TaxID=72036 RepID=A0A7R8D4E4_LEPSM|nr:OSBPL9_10_11 [Lepeophtheirus salmonis]CAF3024763.1 OSBPL9_10_11 [Lepeophtheirus salmonis]